MTVTGALSSPMLISGSASGFSRSAGGMVCASAAPSKRGSAETPSTARLSAATAVLWQNSRRVMRN